MTYFGFLAIFLGIPIAILGALLWRDQRRGRELPLSLQSVPAAVVVLVHVVLAVLYTTPWDNYLVATGVWWYEPALVTGITLGWVPIEEYTFFVVQTILASLWLLFLARRLAEPGQFRPSRRIRWWATGAIGTIWLASALVLAAGWQPGTYLGLELVWALPPIMLQLAFGADILWHRRRLVGLTLMSMTLYLATADSLAIGAGTWTINPRQSLHLLLGGVLPVEELVFFLLTNTLVVFGATLLLSQESRLRAGRLFGRLRGQTPDGQEWRAAEG